MTPPVLDFDPSREGVAPKEAATLVVLRDTDHGVEVFCVERSKQSKFMGGAVVFPGGKLDPTDLDARWIASVGAASPRNALFSADPDTARGLAIAACREALEEAALFFVAGGALAHDDVLRLRARAATDHGVILEALESTGLVLDLAALEPLARWLTPTAEARRFDTRFYLARAPEGQAGAHDAYETTSSFWATAADVLARFARREVFLAPPTQRTLEHLLAAETVDAAFAVARRASLDVICPKLVVQDGTMALVLPGDPEHDVPEMRSIGKSRYVMRGDVFLPEDAPNLQRPSR
ncbi:MAG: hypothetical protein ABI551_18530 [Polyangiaceae bacterium]